MATRKPPAPARRRSVLLAGTLDTKGAEFAFVRTLLRERGLDVICVDVGVMGEPGFTPDISRNDVAAAAGADIQRLRRDGRKDEAMAAMARGLPVVVTRQYRDGRIDGMLGMGGSCGTSIATAGMRALPVGTPKLMVSTVAGGDVSRYVGSRDITVMPSVVDIAGFNRISERIYRNAAAAIAGMVTAAGDVEPRQGRVVAMTMFGNTTPAVDRARALLEHDGFEVLVFHATGAGGRAMEALVRDGLVDAVLDMTTTELADEVCGGIMSAGPERCLAAPLSGVPVVLVPGCVDMAVFAARATVPQRYAGRLFYQWNPDVTLMRTDAAENTAIGHMLGHAAGAATGPVAVMIPRRGVSMLDVPGGAFHDPGADAACFTAIRDGLRPGVELIELDCTINDAVFATRAAETVRTMLSPAREAAPAGTRR